MERSISKCKAQNMGILLFLVILLKTVDGSLTLDYAFNAVVAKDGTGNYSKIVDAIAAAPNQTIGRYNIKIKAGVYAEYVLITKDNITLVGDGMNSTVITGDRSNGTGWKTSDSATVGIVGRGFIAIDLTFENTAGPDNHQAVALRSHSDFSAFYRCRFAAFQDTLYIHFGIQFYRECEIYGTVDFIFGDATAVLQNCDIYVRRPLDGQQNTITAQGREAASTTGLSIHNCSIKPTPELVSMGIKSYLGRPWKNYSRTVIMQSTLDGFIDPAGWLEWDNSTASRETIFYREYRNTGVGADTSRRVGWKGYGEMHSDSEAVEFTVRRFIHGEDWLPSTGIPYFLDLI